MPTIIESISQWLQELGYTTNNLYFAEPLTNYLTIYNTRTMNPIIKITVIDTRIEISPLSHRSGIHYTTRLHTIDLTHSNSLQELSDYLQTIRSAIFD